MAKKVTFITPVGTLVFPKLNTPDVYKPKRGPEKVRYTTLLKLAPEDYKKVHAKLLAHAKKMLPDVEDPKLPFKQDKKTKEMLLTASSGVKYRPPVFDAKNKQISADKIIGGGSKARLDLSVAIFEIADDNSGVNLYINGVQIIELVEGGFKSNFEETEGYTDDGQSEPEGDGFGGGQADGADKDEDFGSL
jgi:hypothetical protein